MILAVSLWVSVSVPAFGSAVYDVLVFSDRGIPVLNIVRKDSTGISTTNLTDLCLDKKGLVINNNCYDVHLGDTGNVEANKNFTEGAWFEPCYSANDIVIYVSGEDPVYLEGEIIFSQDKNQSRSLTIISPKGFVINNATFPDDINVTLLAQSIEGEIGASGGIRVMDGGLRALGKLTLKGRTFLQEGPIVTPEQLVI